MAALETVSPTEPMKGLQVLIPASTHRELAVEAARRDTTMGEVVAEALASYLGIDVAKAKQKR